MVQIVLGALEALDHSDHMLEDCSKIFDVMRGIIQRTDPVTGRQSCSVRQLVQCEISSKAISMVDGGECNRADGNGDECYRATCYLSNRTLDTRAPNSDVEHLSGKQKLLVVDGDNEIVVSLFCKSCVSALSLTSFVLTLANLFSSILLNCTHSAQK